MDADHIINRLKELKNQRINFETFWQECAELILPRKSDIINPDPIVGQQKSQKVYDSTAIEANELFASSLHGMLVSYTAPWFKIESSDAAKNESEAAYEWFQDVTEKMRAAIHDPKAGFTAALDEFFLDLGCFGTGIVEVEEGNESLISFEASNVREEFLGENKDGVIDTSIKIFPWSARKIQQKFPDGNFSEELRIAMKEKPDQVFDIIYAVMPREDYNPEKKDGTNKPVASVWIEEKKKSIIQEGGFDEFPKMGARWRKLSNETYGRGPGMTALPDIKMLNAMEKSLILAAELVLNPPLDVPHKGYVGKIRAYAGGVNYRKGLGNEKIEVINTVGAYPIAEEKAEQKRLAIRRMFFNDQLQLSQGPNMTAFEVAQRMNEKLRLMAPMLGRIQSELLGSLLDRVFFILLRKGVFKEPPAELRGTSTRIRYLSQLAQAQAATEVDAMLKSIGFGAQLAGFDPAVMDNFDLDESTMIASKIFGHPAEALRDDEAKQEIRDDRAAQQQEEQRREAAEREAETNAKTTAAEAQAFTAIQGAATNV
jgi:hypothetical protein